MSEKSRLKIPAPAVAVVVILVGALAVDRLLLAPKATAPAPERDAETSSSGAQPPLQERPPAPTWDYEFVEAVGPTVTPVATTWSTYHGGPDLTGLADAAIPNEPAVLWRFQTDGQIYYTPVANEYGIYTATLKGAVYGLDFDGNQRWKQRLVREVRDDGSERMERLDAPIACFGSTVYVSTLDGTVYALESTNGDVKWRYEVDGPVLGTVNRHEPRDEPDGAYLFVIAQEDGALHAIGEATGEQLWQAEAIDRCDGSATVSGGQVVFGSCAAAIHLFSVEDGKRIRDIELDPDSQVASGAAIAGDSVFAGSHSGRFFHGSLSTGKLVWVNRDAQDEIFSTPAVSEEFVVFASYDGNVYALDRTTGEKVWTLETRGYPTSAVIPRDKVAVGIDGVLHLLRLDNGEMLWSYEVSDEIASPAIIRDMIVVGSADGTVTAFGEPSS